MLAALKRKLLLRKIDFSYFLVVGTKTICLFEGL